MSLGYSQSRYPKDKQSVIPVFGESAIHGVATRRAESVIHGPNGRYGLRGRKATFAESVAFEEELLSYI